MNDASDTHLLIVDDDPSSSQLVAFALERAGYWVHHATTPDEAQRIVQQEPIALAIIDAILGEHDGFALATTLRASGDGLEVIMVSALAEDELARRSASAGVADWLGKPIHFPKLQSAVNRLATKRPSS